MKKRFITVREASEFLSLHPVTVRRLIGKGKIPASRVGRSVRIDLKALIQKMEEQQESY